MDVPCYVTPKRIYATAGRIFDRATGAQILSKEHRIYSDYRMTVDPASLKPREQSK
jgi:hypothetical protein